MKKTIIILLSLIVLLALGACDSNRQAIDETFVTNNAVSTDDTTTTTTTTTTQTSLDMLIDTEYYTLSVPNSWNDDCFYEVVDGERYNYTLSFYDKESYDAINGGWLFSINLFTEFEDYSNYPKYDVLGSLEVYRIGSYDIVVTYPTDVQYSEETAEKYHEMSAAIADILKTISFMEECTFSNETITSKAEHNDNITSEANIEIIAIYPCNKGIDDITVDYRINNIHNTRGCVYLHSDSLSYFHQMFFRDENHIDEYREDGKYSFNVGWLNDGSTKYLSILYGYGEFNSETGWTNECRTKIYYRLVEDYGRISSNTIPQDEIYDIYDGDKYIGGWTLNPSGDLIEVDGDSEKDPFTQNSSFYSETGNSISVYRDNGNYVFYVNGNMIGFDDEGMKVQDELLYEIDIDNGSYLITRYPNDGYISVSVVGQINTSIEGIYYP